MLRQIIISVLGHVDHGKSSIVDTIKKTSIVKSEPGKITQSIKAYSLSLKTIKNICQDLIDIEKIKVPGLLIIDTPGHAAFINLRKRGGSLADIAILVVDINEGLKPQTLESLEILKENKTPFVIALNKIDLIQGFQHKEHSALLKTLNLQFESVKKTIEEKLYNLVASLYELGFNSERFDRIDDFTKTIAIVPISAKQSDGIPELLMVLTGLAQKFLESKLEYDQKSPAEGTILEVKEEKGLGITLDTIIYKGTIKTNDQIVIGTLQEPVITKVKGLFLYEGKNLIKINEAEAAIGVRICAPETKNVISGMPLKVIKDNLEEAKKEIQEQVRGITFELDNEGIVIKADALGSLEGLIYLLKDKGIKIKRASIGDISKKDITEAEANSDKIDKVILGFNVNSVNSDSVKIITNQVVYKLVEDFEEWKAIELEKEKVSQFKDLIKPCKLKILQGYIFRQSNPAVVGIEILEGVLKSGVPLMKDSNKITEAKALQDKGKNIQEAKKNEQVAVSLPGITINKQIKENDILYSDITESQFKAYKLLKEHLSPEDKQILKEIAELKRKISPSWGT